MKIWNWIKSFRLNIEIYHTKSLEELLAELPLPPFSSYELICKCGLRIKIPYIAGEWPSWKSREELSIICSRCNERVTFNTADIYSTTPSK